LLIFIIVIIIAAGIVMAIVFSGLIISEMAVLVQFELFSFFLVVLLLGPLNWFPSKKCLATRDVDDMSDEMNELKTDKASDWEIFMEFKPEDNYKCLCCLCFYKAIKN
jgi:hypothetical protein